MNPDKIRIALQKELESEDIGLRTLEARTGISFSTLSRFLRGAELEFKNIEKLHCYVTGQKLPERKAISSRRMTVSGKTFLITIEELTKEKKEIVGFQKTFIDGKEIVISKKS